VRSVRAAAFGILCCFASCLTAHPLDALTTDELNRAVQILHEAKLAERTARFGIVRLQEPPKAEVLAWHPGVELHRLAFVNLRQDRRLYQGVVDLTAGKVANWTEIKDQQMSFLLEEIMGAADIVKADAGWRAAMKLRGYTRYEDITCNPLAAGFFGATTPRNQRLMNVPCFDMVDKENNIFARPIEGLMAVVDLDTRKVLRLIDLGVLPVPGKAPTHDHAKLAKYRGALKPVEITAPVGANFSIADGVVKWDNWSFHLRMDRRVGAVVSLVRYDDRGRQRQIAYQISPSEMFVPYMDPAPTWSFKGYMDVGEYGFGVLASPLAEGRDCPRDAAYLSVALADDTGKPMAMEKVVCVFERATGDPVWRHYEVFTQTEESRPETELVVRFVPTVGNYDYLIDYVFNQKGEIAVRVGATGIDAVKGVASTRLSDPTAAADTAYGTLVAPNLVAINHDHYINFRLDLDIDGQENTFVEDALVPTRLPADSVRRSLWTVHSEEKTEEGPVSSDLHHTFWRVINPNHRSAMGYPTGMVIMGGHADQSLLTPDDPPQSRAAFSAAQLWVTRYRPEELYAAGDFPNQSAGGEGLPKYVARHEPAVNTDLVFWYTVGFRHVPRAEDWPVMPTLFTGFMLRPQNFFDASPSLDVAPNFAPAGGDAGSH
jgi:primary-amine oxidase